jgi:alkyl hydroperoxide reductase subunit AhpC
VQIYKEYSTKTKKWKINFFNAASFTKNCSARTANKAAERRQLVARRRDNCSCNKQQNNGIFN